LVQGAFDQSPTLKQSNRGRDTLPLFGCKLSVDPRRQRRSEPVYFTNRALHGAKERYSQIEKLAFALVVLARRLRLYFQAHAIKVLIEYPMKKVLQKPNILGSVVNLVIELGEFDIEFLSRTTIKGQTLVDSLVEFYNVLKSEELPKGKTWVAYVEVDHTDK
jgi:hypothetical protein